MPLARFCGVFAQMRRAFPTSPYSQKRCKCRWRGFAAYSPKCDVHSQPRHIHKKSSIVGWVERIPPQKRANHRKRNFFRRRHINQKPRETQRLSEIDPVGAGFPSPTLTNFRPKLPSVICSCIVHSDNLTIEYPRTPLQEHSIVPIHFTYVNFFACRSECFCLGCFCLGYLIGVFDRVFLRISAYFCVLLGCFCVFLRISCRSRFFANNVHLCKAKPISKSYN